MNPSDIAFFILDNERDEHGEFWVLLAERGKPGYARTDWHWGTDRELAEQLCRERNERIGLSEQDVAVLIASTLGKTKKDFEVFIRWGRSSDHDEDEDETHYYSFDTQAELNAFLNGVDEANGWLDYEIVADKDPQ